MEKLHFIKDREKILKITYDLFIANNWKTTRVAELMNVSRVTVLTRKRELEALGYEVPKDYSCICFPTNEYRIRHLDQVSNYANIDA